MPIRSFIVGALLSGAFAFPVAADPLGDAINDLVRDVPALSGDRVDLDGDGEMEGFLFPDEACQAPCPFIILDMTASGDIGVAARGSAKNAVVRDANPSGKVIDADGVIYAWDGYEFFPHFDLLDRISDRTATVRDRQIVRRATGTDHYAPNMTAYDTDIVEGRENETVIIVNSVFANGMAPFHIFDSTGERIHHGYSVDRPRIYPVVEEGEKRARVLSVTPGGLQVETLK